MVSFKVLVVSRLNLIFSYAVEVVVLPDVGINRFLVPQPHHLLLYNFYKIHQNLIDSFLYLLLLLPIIPSLPSSIMLSLFSFSWQLLPPTSQNIHFFFLFYVHCSQLASPMSHFYIFFLSWLWAWLPSIISDCFRLLRWIGSGVSQDSIWVCCEPSELGAGCRGVGENLRMGGYGFFPNPEEYQ